MKDLRGKNVWVVGASSGIGAALADELVGRGCRVAISARRRTALDAVSSGRMHIETVDVESPDEFANTAQRVRQELGSLDVVVFAAGFWEQMDAGGFDRALFARHIEANVMGMANGIAAVLPDMVQQGRGQIVGISSVAGYRGMPGAQGYGAAKAAQINLLESLRCGMRGTGVVVQTVAPGFVETPMTAVNDFPMPFIITAERAAKRIADGIARGKAEIVFPFPMMLAMKLARMIPNAVWPRLFKPQQRASA